MPSPVQSGAVADREGHEDARHARVQPRVGEQQQAVGGDGDQAGDRQALVPRAHARGGRGRDELERRDEAEDRDDAQRREADDAGGAAGQPPGVVEGVEHDGGLGSATPWRPGRGGHAHGATQGGPSIATAATARRAARRRAGMTSTAPSSWTSTPPCSARTARPPRGPRSSATLASTSASSALRPTAVAASRPVQAGRPVDGSSRWWAGAPRSSSHRRRWIPEVATPPPPSAEAMGDLAGQRMDDGHLVRPAAAVAEREVAADVDDEAQPAQARGDEVGRQALAEPAAVEHDTRRAADRAGAAVDAERLPARGGMRRGGRSGRSGRQRRRQRCRLTGPVPVVSRLGDLGAQGHVHQPAGATARPRAGADQRADVLVGGQLAARIAGERVEVGGRIEARPAALELGQQRPRIGGGVLQARRGLRAGHAVGEHQAPARAHHREVRRRAGS